MGYTVKKFNADLENPYAWPGGYPRFFVTQDGESLSFEAARENKGLIKTAIREGFNEGWRVVGCDINWEDPDLYCCHTGRPIESAYA